MHRFHQPHWGKHEWAVVLGSLLCVALVIGGVIASVMRSDQGPLEPTLKPTPSEQATIGPGTPATFGTPGIVFDPDPAPRRGSLPEMLAFAPDRLADGSLPLSDIAQYADIQAWMQANDLPLPTGPDDPNWVAWQAEIENLAIPEVVSTRGTDPVWLDTYGFGLHQVHQVLAVGSAPDYVLVFRGDFDAEALHTAWVESGYQAVRVQGVTVWSLYPGDSVDLSAPASRPALGNLNNIVLLDDGTLIATSRLSRLQQTVSVIDGTQPALIDNADVKRLLSPGTESDQLVTATLMRGSVLESLPATPTVATPMLIGTPIADQPLPQADYLLVGLLPPGDSAVMQVVIVASYDDADVATRALIRAQRELSTGDSAYSGNPFANTLQPGSMMVLATTDTDALLVMHLWLVDDVSEWRSMVEHRDYGYIMWPREP